MAGHDRRPLDMRYWRYDGDLVTFSQPSDREGRAGKRNLKEELRVGVVTEIDLEI